MILKILKKDLMVLLANKKSLILFILMPIVLTTILSMSLKSTFNDNDFNVIKIAIVKEYDSNSDFKKFIEKINKLADYEFDFENNEINPENIFFNDFLGNEDIKEVINYYDVSEEEAENLIRNDEISAIVYLPENFVYDQLINFIMPNRNEINIKIAVNPEMEYSGEIAKMIIKSYFSRMNDIIIRKNSYLEVGSKYLEVDKLFENMKTIIESLTNQVEEENYDIENLKIPGERSIDSSTYYSIGMMGMFILYVAGYVGKELLREKKKLTLDRGTVMGVNYTKVLGSKFISTFILCFIQMSVLLIYSRIILKVQWVYSLEIMLAIVFTALGISGFGIFLSSLTLYFDNYKISNIFENIIIHILALIGGSYVPINQLPDFIAKLKFLAFNGIVLDLFLGIYRGKSINLLNKYFISLVGISMIFSAIAIIIVRKKEALSHD